MYQPPHYHTLIALAARARATASEHAEGILYPGMVLGVSALRNTLRGSCLATFLSGPWSIAHSRPWLFMCGRLSHREMSVIIFLSQEALGGSKGSSENHAFLHPYPTLNFVAVSSKVAKTKVSHRGDWRQGETGMSHWPVARALSPSLPPSLALSLALSPTWKLKVDQAASVCAAFQHYFDVVWFMRLNGLQCTFRCLGWAFRRLRTHWFRFVFFGYVFMIHSRCQPGSPRLCVCVCVCVCVCCLCVCVACALCTRHSIDKGFLCVFTYSRW